jgi:hypothetical protein
LQKSRVGAAVRSPTRLIGRVELTLWLWLLRLFRFLRLFALLVAVAHCVRVHVRAFQSCGMTIIAPFSSRDEFAAPCVAMPENLPQNGRRSIR